MEDDNQMEEAVNPMKMFLKLHAKYIYDICTKKCITDFKSKELSDKERICLSRCYDRKRDSIEYSQKTLHTFLEAHQKKQETLTKEFI